MVSVRDVEEVSQHINNMTMTLLFLVFLVALLNGTTYQNNSIVTLEDIGEDGGALLCITNSTVMRYANTYILTKKL